MSSNQLPSDLEATVFLTLHFGKGDKGDAAELLPSHSSLPLRMAREGQPIET